MVILQYGGSVNLGECPNAFLAKFFLLGKTNALRNKISGFQQLMDDIMTEAWERLQDYIAACPHHGMRSGSSSKASIVG
jgi:hypothetical protein